MRRLNRFSVSLPSLCVLAIVALTTTACSRNSTIGPEARLGSTPGNYDRAGQGTFGRLTGNGPAGSPQQFQTSGIDTVYFVSDSVSLTPDAAAALVQQARWLHDYPTHTITIEGHADERGTREYNIALGAKRAETVKAFLTGRGVASARIRTLSYGKERPVASCNDISCWSQNRRAHTRVAVVAHGRR